MLAAWGILSAALLAPSPEPVVLPDAQGQEERTARDIHRLLELAAQDLDRSMRSTSQIHPFRSIAPAMTREAAAISLFQADVWPALEALPGLVSFFSLSPMQEGEVHRVVISYGPSLAAEAPERRESARAAVSAFSRGF